MSFITWIPLNPKRSGTRKLLASRQVAHAMIESCFPNRNDNAEGRILWRLDREGGLGLVIVSPTLPAVGGVVEQCGFGASDAQPITANYSSSLSAINNGDVVTIRATLNAAQQNESGKRTAVRAPEVEGWVTSKLIQSGLDVASLTIDEYSTDTFRRGAHAVTLALVSVKAEVIVRDRDSFRTALVCGVGAAKGYGCGLITIE